jgi:hypothetical protein
MKKANYIYKFIFAGAKTCSHDHNHNQFFIPGQLTSDQSQFQLFLHFREKGSGVVKGVKGGGSKSKETKLNLALV